MASVDEISIDVSQLSAEDLEEFLISINFDKNIAAKLKG